MEPEKNQNLSNEKSITQTIAELPVIWRVIIAALFSAVLLNIFLLVYLGIYHPYENLPKELGVKEKDKESLILDVATKVPKETRTDIIDTLENQETWFTFITPQRDVEVLMPGIPHLLLDEDLYLEESKSNKRLDYVYTYNEDDENERAFALSRRDYSLMVGKGDSLDPQDLMNEEIAYRLAETEIGSELLSSRLVEHGDLKGFSYAIRDKFGYLDVKYVLIDGTKVYYLVYLGKKSENYNAVIEKFFGSFKKL